MKTQITIVPKDKNPLDVLKELGKRTKSAWIFMDYASVEQLKSIASWRRPYPHNRSQELHWRATITHTESILTVEDKYDQMWQKVLSIHDSDIYFKKPADNPKEIFFLKIEK